MEYIILDKFNVDILAYIESKQAFCPVFFTPFIDGKLQKLTVIEDCCRLPVKFRFPVPV